MSDNIVAIEHCDQTKDSFMEKLDQLRNDMLSKFEELHNVLKGDFENPGLITKYHLLNTRVEQLETKTKKNDNKKSEIVNWVYKAVITALVSAVAAKLFIQ